MLQLKFQITPIFEAIIEQCEFIGLYMHHDRAKETIQFFRNQASFEQAEKYLGAIQYEGSNNYEIREPSTVSWRFKRSNISQELEQALEEITAFRKDKESGPAINQTSESIAFKFQQINRIEKQVILQIADVLQRYIR